MSSETESETETNGGLDISDKDVNDLLLDWMNAMSDDVPRARFFKLAAAVDDIDDAIVIDFIHYTDNLHKQMLADLNNADEHYSGELDNLEREYQRKRKACLERRLSDRQNIIEKGHKLLEEENLPTLCDAIYKQLYPNNSVKSPSSSSSSSVKLPAKNGASTSAPIAEKGKKKPKPPLKSAFESLLTYIDEFEIDEDIKELRRGIVESKAKQIIRTMLEHSKKLMNEIEKRSKEK